MTKLKLAIVDDHELFTDGIKSLLAGFSHIETIITAADGLDFLTQLKSASDLPEIVLLDLKMPNMDGIETMKVLKKEYPDMKVIILSMHQENEFIMHLIKLGTNGYLLKNSTVNEVKTAIDTVMSEGYYYNDYLVKVMREGIMKYGGSPKTVSLDYEAQITARELEVLKLICKQYTTQEIGEELFLSKRTIEGHRQKLLEKTQTKNTAGLIVYCINKGIIEPKGY